MKVTCEQNFVTESEIYWVRLWESKYIFFHYSASSPFYVVLAALLFLRLQSAINKPNSAVFVRKLNKTYEVGNCSLTGTCRRVPGIICICRVDGR